MASIIRAVRYSARAVRHYSDKRRDPSLAVFHLTATATPAEDVTLCIVATLPLPIAHAATLGQCIAALGLTPWVTLTQGEEPKR